MLKTIKRILFLASFLSSSIFPMTRVAQALLIRRTLNQISSFHHSLQTKCPLSSAAFLWMVEEVSKNQELTDTKSDLFTKDPVAHQQPFSNFASNQARPSCLQMTEQRHTNEYLESKAIYWQTKSTNTASVEALNHNNHLAHKHAKLDLVQEVFVATIKSQIHNLARNYVPMIKEAAIHVKNFCCSLSHHEALAKKEIFAQELASLKNMLMLAIQKNSNAYLIANRCKLDENSLDHMQDSWTANDFMNALTILKLELEIQKTTLFILECNIIIQQVERVTHDFTHSLERLSINALENDLKPWLTDEQRLNKIALDQEKQIVELHTKELAIINAKLEPFARKSIWAKIGGTFNPNYSQESLKEAKEFTETEINDSHDRLKYLYDKQRANNAQYTCLQKKLDDLHTDLSESKKSNDCVFSSQAQQLIARTNFEFAALDTLSAQNRQQVTSLVNRAAQEQINIHDASYDEIITTTIEVADSACQAFQKGKSELGDALVNFAHSVLDCSVAFSKGLAQGACKSIQNNWQAIKDPVHTLTNLAKGVVHLAGCLHPIGVAVVTGSNIIWAVNNLEQALLGARQKLNDMPLTEIFEILGEKTGEFGTDLLILDGALKSASIVKNIAVAEAAIIIKKAEQGLAELGEFAKTEITALTESKEVLVKTAEGFEVAIDAKRADIAKETQALHSEANTFNKTKNGLKSEGATARASKGATQFGPNGGYSDAGYHHFQSTGKIKSRGPKSGIEAVNNSAEVLNKGGIQHQNKQRIGISNGEFVVLNRTHKGATRAEDIFHGHVREWKDLGDEIQKALKKARLTDDNGKILKK